MAASKQQQERETYGGPAEDDKSSGRATESNNGRVGPSSNGRADTK